MNGKDDKIDTTKYEQVKRNLIKDENTLITLRNRIKEMIWRPWDCGPMCDFSIEVGIIFFFSCIYSLAVLPLIAKTSNVMLKTLFIRSIMLSLVIDVHRSGICFIIGYIKYITNHLWMKVPILDNNDTRWNLVVKIITLPSAPIALLLYIGYGSYLQAVSFPSDSDSQTGINFFEIVVNNYLTWIMATLMVSSIIWVLTFPYLLKRLVCESNRLEASIREDLKIKEKIEALQQKARSEEEAKARSRMEEELKAQRLKQEQEGLFKINQAIAMREFLEAMKSVHTKVIQQKIEDIRRSTLMLENIDIIPDALLLFPPTIDFELEVLNNVDRSNIYLAIDLSDRIRDQYFQFLRSQSSFFTTHQSIDPFMKSDNYRDTIPIQFRAGSIDFRVKDETMFQSLHSELINSLIDMSFELFDQPRVFRNSPDLFGCLPSQDGTGILWFRVYKPDNLKLLRYTSTAQSVHFDSEIGTFFNDPNFDPNSDQSAFEILRHFDDFMSRFSAEHNASFHN